MSPLQTPSAFFDHVWRAVTLRHDLGDVPDKRDTALFTLIVLAIGAALTLWCLIGADPNALGVILSVSIGLTLCTLTMPAQVMSVCVLATIGIDLAGAAFTAIGLNVAHGLGNFVLLGWLIACCCAAHARYRRANTGREPK